MQQRKQNRWEPEEKSIISERSKVTEEDKCDPKSRGDTEKKMRLAEKIFGNGIFLANKFLGTHLIKMEACLK
jgi:hypothetical protein